MDKFDLTHDDKGWKVQKATSNHTLIRTDTKAEALKEAAAMLKKRPEGGSLNVHLETGRCQEERTYPRSKDPKKTPG